MKKHQVNWSPEAVATAVSRSLYFTDALEKLGLPRTAVSGPYINKLKRIAKENGVSYSHINEIGPIKRKGKTTTLPEGKIKVGIYYKFIYQGYVVVSDIQESISLWFKKNNELPPSAIKDMYAKEMEV